MLVDDTKDLKYEIKAGRAVALKDFADIKKGEIGGFVYNEKNLSQEGSCWVGGEAQVYGKAQISGDARVYGYARVYGEVQIYGDARVYGYARVYGEAQVFGDAEVFESAEVSGEARVYGEVQVSGNTRVSGEVYLPKKNSIILSLKTSSWEVNVYSNDTISIGCKTFTFEEIRNLWLKSEIDKIDDKAWAFAQNYYDIILRMIKVQEGD